MQPYTQDNLFGSQLINKVYECLLQADKPLTSREIGEMILHNANMRIEHEPAQDNFFRRLQNKLKSISDGNSLLIREKCLTDVKTVFYKYSIKKNQPNGIS